MKRPGKKFRNNRIDPSMFRSVKRHRAGGELLNTKDEVIAMYRHALMEKKGQSWTHREKARS